MSSDSEGNSSIGSASDSEGSGIGNENDKSRSGMSKDSDGSSSIGNASDSDGSVTVVEFFADGSLIGQATAAPWTFVWMAPPVGPHVLTARATDDDGASTTSASRSITVTSGSGDGTVTLQRGRGYATADTYLSTYHRTLNFGFASTVLDERQNYSGLYRFAIFQSEGGPVPDGATITSATLSLYKATPYDMTYSVHRVLVDWSETAATWNQRLPGTPWAVAGANGSGSDYVLTADATASVGFDPGWVNFDVRTAVQQMSSASASNFGWRLRGVGGYTSALKQIYGSEFTGSADLRPKLVVTWF
jgi:hypothetical protein